MSAADPEQQNEIPKETEHPREEDLKKIEDFSMRTGVDVIGKLSEYTVASYVRYEIGREPANIYQKPVESINYDPGDVRICKGDRFRGNIALVFDAQVKREGQSDSTKQMVFVDIHQPSKDHPMDVSSTLRFYAYEGKQEKTDGFLREHSYFRRDDVGGRKNKDRLRDYS